MSKRTERIARAKARTSEETAELRRKERERPASIAAKFVSGPAKGRTLVEITEEQEVIRKQQRELDKQQKQAASRRQS